MNYPKNVNENELKNMKISSMLLMSFGQDKLCKNADLSANSLQNVILKMHPNNSFKKTTPNVYIFNIKWVRKQAAKNVIKFQHFDVSFGQVKSINML